MIVWLGEAEAVGFGVGVGIGVGGAVATAVAGVVGLSVGIGVGLAWATRGNVLDIVISIAKAMVTLTRKPTMIMTRPALILACSRIK
jgi:hypothetical protein